MIYNNLKLILRLLVRSKLFSFINIGGLAIGLASCVLIIYYVQDELSFDRFNERADRIHRVTTTFIDPPNTNRLRFTDQKIGPYLKRNQPQIEEVVRFSDFTCKVQWRGDLIVEPNIFSTDASVFKVFSYPLVAGNPETVFSKKNSIVLSENLADKYFKGDAIGKELTINQQVFEVTGIMKDVPTNSDKWVNGLVYEEFPGEESPGIQIRFDTYVLFKSTDDSKDFQSALDQAAVYIFNQDKNELGTKYEIQALSDLHFVQGIQMDNAKGNMANIYVFIIVAGILLLVAIFNFINLTTVKSLERAKEVGVRKVIGATPFQLVKQFLGESTVSTVLSSAIAVVLIVSAYPVYNLVTGKTIQFNSINDLILIVIIILLLVVVTLMASIYPAWVLTGFKPISILKGNFSRQAKGQWVRKIFIAGQFGLCAALLVFLMVVVQQLKYSRQTDLGFNKEEILVIEIPNGSDVTAIKNSIASVSGVSGVSVGSWQSVPGGMAGSLPIWYKVSGQEHEIQAQSIEADPIYPDLLELKVLSGKPIKDYPDSQLGEIVLINETLARQTGWTDPVGQTMETFSFSGKKKVTVAGVVRDFHFKSLHSAIDPLIYFPVTDGGGSNLFVRLQSNNLDEIKTTWKKLIPDNPIQFSFLNDSFDKQYKAEETMFLLLLTFAGLTIALAGLGLFGLTAYVVETRTKEIGIRKVLGAGSKSIIQLLSIDFIKLVLMGAIGGSVVSYFFSGDWLEQFAYKIELTVWLAAIPIGLILVFAIAIISFRTYSAAQLNPANTLKYE